MHGLPVVAQSLSCESFGINDGFGSFGPSLAVTVECHAGNAKLAATLAEFGGSVPCLHAGQIRKQRTIARNNSENHTVTWLDKRSRNRGRVTPHSYPPRCHLKSGCEKTLRPEPKPRPRELVDETHRLPPWLPRAGSATGVKVLEVYPEYHGAVRMLLADLIMPGRVAGKN